MQLLCSFDNVKRVVDISFVPMSRCHFKFVPYVFCQVCPVCASLPGGDPNLMTDDLSGHLNLEHRSGPRDLISFLISF